MLFVWLITPIVGATVIMGAGEVITEMIRRKRGDKNSADADNA